jgi:hypothetical protein
LGFAGIRCSRLYLWSREVDPKVDASWVPRRVIKIQKDRNHSPVTNPVTDVV